MSKRKSKQTDKDREVSPQPAANITLAEISLLQEELRASLAVDFRSSVETLATKLDNIQSIVSDLAQKVDSLDSNTTEVDQHFVQLESLCSSLQRDSEWLKTKVTDLEGCSRPQNI